ncbi:MAG: MFS transporter [Pontixanthobacter sp.]
MVRSGTNVEISGMLLTVVGMQVFILQPGLITILVSNGGLTETMAGYASSADIFGIAIATIAAAILSHKLNWRWLATGALGLLVAADLVSAWYYASSLFIPIRIIAGLGSGLLISLGFAITGMSGNPDRSFGILIAIVMLFGAAGLYLMPWLTEIGGVSLIYLILTGVAATGLVAVRNIPVTGQSENSSAGANVGTAGERPQSRRNEAIALLCAVSCFYLAQGAIWPFFGLLGAKMGIGIQDVANGLTVGQISGIAGAFAVAVGQKLGHRFLTAIGVIGCVFALFGLNYQLDAYAFGVNIKIFYFGTNLLTALLMAMVAGIDPTGRLVQSATAIQMLGISAGTATATTLVGLGYTYSNLLALAISLFVLCGIAIALQFVMRRHRPVAIHT